MISANGADGVTGIIDVWDIDTFDNQLRSELDAYAEVIRDYMITSRRQSREHDASDHRMPYPENRMRTSFWREGAHNAADGGPNDPGLALHPHDRH